MLILCLVQKRRRITNLGPTLYLPLNRIWNPLLLPGIVRGGGRICKNLFIFLSFSHESRSFSLSQTRNLTSPSLTLITQTNPSLTTLILLSGLAGFNVIEGVEEPRMQFGLYNQLILDPDSLKLREGPNVNVAFITHDKELVLPLFDNILSGCTAKRLLELAPKLVEKGSLKGVRIANLTAEEAKGAAEMMYAGSTLPLLPIIMWDGQPIGDGEVGELTMALSDLLWDDMVASPEAHKIPVPYQE